MPFREPAFVSQVPDDANYSIEWEMWEDMATGNAQDITITPDSLNLLKQIQARCQEIQADFVVMLPVGFTNEYEPHRRIMHALQITRLGIPVLKDERLGREPDNSLYADTIYHQNAKGTDRNSRIIARLLKSKSYWSEQELQEQMKSHGFTESSTPQK